MKILLVKVSSLGDIVHTMPVVADILHAIPDAEIDWVVEEGFAELPRMVRGVRRVIPLALRRWRKQRWARTTRTEAGAFLRQLRAERYDYVIDAQGLIKTAVLAALARGPVTGLGNRTAGSSYEKPARWFYDRAVRLDPHVHVVERSRLLVAQALGMALPQALDFGIDTASLPRPLADQPPYAVFVHATSRADKCWPEENWVTLGQTLHRRTGLRIVLPWGSAAEREVSERLAAALPGLAVVPPRLSLREVTGMLAGARVTVGVDTGLIHIAAALGLPTVELYNFSTAWRTGGYWSPAVVNLGDAQHPPQPEDVRQALYALGVFS